MCFEWCPVEICSMTGDSKHKGSKFSLLGLFARVGACAIARAILSGLQSSIGISPCIFNFVEYCVSCFDSPGMRA